MRFRQLGQNGPTISALGYGTWQAGGTDWRELPRETVINAIRSALDAGANWLDTAELYAHGRAEELVAEAVSDKTGPDKPLIFTKVAPSGYGSGLHRDGIRRAAEASLSRLGVERIDLYQCTGSEVSLSFDGLLSWVQLLGYGRARSGRFGKSYWSVQRRSRDCRALRSTSRGLGPDEFACCARSL